MSQHDVDEPWASALVAAGFTDPRNAKRLRLDPRTVSSWVGRARSVRVPYVPPSNASLLDSAERDAVNEIIRLLTLNKVRGETDGPRPEAQEKSTQRGGKVSRARFGPGGKRNRILEDAQTVDRAADDRGKKDK